MAADAPTGEAGTRGRLPRPGHRRRRAARAARARTPRGPSANSARLAARLAGRPAPGPDAGGGRAPGADSPFLWRAGVRGLRAWRSRARKVQRASWTIRRARIHRGQLGRAVPARAGRSMRAGWAAPYQWNISRYGIGLPRSRRRPGPRRQVSCGTWSRGDRRRHQARAGGRTSGRSVTAAVNNTSVERRRERVADAPDCAIVKVQPVAVARFECVDVQMDACDREKQHFDFVFRHGSHRRWPAAGNAGAGG